MSIKAVLFDLDGTLINSLEDLANATNYAMGCFGFEAKPAENYNNYAGSGVYIMIKRALQPKVVSDAMLKKIRNIFFDYYSEHYADKTFVYDGFLQLVADLKCRGIKVACVTNKVHKVAQDIISHYFGSFDAVYGQRDDIPIKPDPFLVQKTLAEFKISANECLFVGDSDVDMKTALNSGTVGIGVKWGFHTEDELRQAGASFIVNTPSQILELADTVK